MVLKKDARAVLQFYPETSEQAVIIAQAASKVIMNDPFQFSVGSVLTRSGCLYHF